jgi:hypothetical protein
MKRNLLPILMVYAAIGLALSLYVHVASFFGEPPGGMRLFFALHVAIFPLWFAVLALSDGLITMSGGRMRPRSWDVWRRALSGCPAWMRYMTYGFFGYAIVNFVHFMLTMPMTHGAGHGSLPPGPGVWRGFSGHWMAFYSAGLALAYSACRGAPTPSAPGSPTRHPNRLGRDGAPPA